VQNRVNATTNKVPVLGDLPFLGAAFSQKQFTETEEEMIILVTPRLVHSFDCRQWPRHLPGRETRSADDFELFLEGIMEAPRGSRQATSPYTASHRAGPTAGTFPCGDGSWGRPRCLGRCGIRGGCDGTCGPCGVRQGSDRPQRMAPVTNTVPAARLGFGDEVV